MRLTAIKLAGFKSFVDPMQLPLPSNLTAVVGPNGCGKSNIIDAVRWVLGETSIKNLRAAEADDVIFNGSKTRKPVGRASVELIFDNSDQQIIGPYAAYTDIAVKRELTRDGNSQYTLNGKKCLKRDVTDLFLGTGLGGKNQYAIIEQGMVSRMVEAKPDELRQWLEEAAGISKYKERRKETESRIRQTRENLSRLNDLRSEVTTRVEVLTKQAANAEKYKELKVSERRLKAEILALRVMVLEAQQSSNQAAVESAQTSLEQQKAATVSTAEARTQAEVVLREQQDLLNQEQNKVYEAEGLQARHEQSLKHARELQSLKARELEQLSRQLAELQTREQRETARSVALQAELSQLSSQTEQAQASEGDATAAVSKAEGDATAEQQRWNEHLQRSEAPLSQVEGERVRVQQLDRARFMLEERSKRLQQEHATLNAEPIQSSLSDVEAELQRLLAELSASQSRVAEVDAALTQLRETRAALEASLHENRQGLQSAKGRLASLETLQQAALRQDDADLNQWLKGRNLHAAPRLAGALQAAKGWEAALEHVLSGLLQAPVAALQSPMGAGPKAGASSVDAATGEPHSTPERLSHHVRGPQAVMEFLHGIFVAADEQEAEQRLPQLLAGESVVLPDGRWLGRGWRRWPKTGDGQGGVLAREVLIKQLKAQIETLAAAVQQQEAEANALRQQQQSLELERRDHAGKADQQRQRQAQRMAFKQAQAVRLEQVQGRAAALAQELKALAEQQQQQAQELAGARERLTALEAEANALKAERQELQLQQARARDAVARARSTLLQAAQQRNAVQLRQAGQQSALTALQQTLAELASRIASLAEAQAAQQHEAGALDAPVTQNAAEVEAARVGLQAAREGLRLARERLIAAEKQLAAAQTAAHAAAAALDAGREAVQQSLLQAEGDKARTSALVEQVTETGFTREELQAGLPEGAELAGWEEKLVTVSRRIERLGAINLASIQELEETRERGGYLEAQHQDLASALDTLESAMAKIDGETRELFKATFDKVNTVFMDRFPKLFGGGEAYLELTGESLLDTGVRVMARPPGKRNSTIQLLSGGEKAMTAVALLLALFQLNPAPFCLMDEVDAPLDDANVGRFCEIVREMSQGVQFIIITHNKITMELAKQLHGVTMLEPGVSRLVSVDVEQAVQLTGSDNAQDPAPPAP